MTNGEKIQTILDVDRDCTEVHGENGTMTFTVTQDWWNAEYEPTTPNDCETCIHNKGVLECDMYGCNGFTGCAGNFQEVVDGALDVVCRYQKIKQILKDIPYGGEATVRRIQEVVEDE